MDKKVIYAVLAVIIVAVASAGITYAVCDKDGDNTCSNAETYDFYLYFGADNKDNGWYTGNGDDAALGFKDAMDKAGFTYTLSTYGYIGSINGVENSWMTYQYLYANTDKNASTSSVLTPNYDKYNLFTKSDGWSSIVGYDDANVTFKFSELNGNVFIISNFVWGTDAEPDPVALYSSWSTSGIFAD